MSAYQGSTSFASNPLGISPVFKLSNGSPHRLYSKNLAVVQQHCMYEIATRPNIAEELQFLNLSPRANGLNGQLPNPVQKAVSCQPFSQGAKHMRCMNKPPAIPTIKKAPRCMFLGKLSCNHTYRFDICRRDTWHTSEITKNPRATVQVNHDHKGKQELHKSLPSLCIHPEIEDLNHPRLLPL